LNDQTSGKKEVVCFFTSDEHRQVKFVLD